MTVNGLILGPVFKIFPKKTVLWKCSLVTIPPFPWKKSNCGPTPMMNLAFRSVGKLAMWPSFATCAMRTDAPAFILNQTKSVISASCWDPVSTAQEKREAHSHCRNAYDQPSHTCLFSLAWFSSVVPRMMTREGKW